MSDRNFDDIADKFSQNIYQTDKGKIRQAILWQYLTMWLADQPSRPLYILDAGGGQGIMACRLAKLGHKIILCDISGKMLAKAQTLARQQNVESSIQFIHCSAQDVAQYLQRPVDLILFHAVLEWIANPREILATLKQYLQPQGVLSLMYYNYNGLLFKNIQLGNIGYINAGMRKRKKRTLSPDNPLHPQHVDQWLTELEMNIISKSGVRVFHDYIQTESIDFSTLLSLEQQFCRKEPFLSLGRYIHIMAQNYDK